MHRTVSLDVVVVTVGEVELTLSNGDSRLVNAGDVVIQRSTLHKWRNTSESEWARMIGIMSECQPVVTEEAGVLKEEFLIG
jgi:quercetin dioxygenase-like cupin family protein